MGGCLGEGGRSPSWWRDAGGLWNGPPSREGGQANIHRSRDLTVRATSCYHSASKEISLGLGLRYERVTMLKECKRCGGVLDIQSPGRPRGTTASEGYGVSVVHVTCSYGYE